MRILELIFTYTLFLSFRGCVLHKHCHENKIKVGKLHIGIKLLGRTICNEQRGS